MFPQENELTYYYYYLTRYPFKPLAVCVACAIRRRIMATNKVGSVLVVGGGISGMQAALDLADSGYLVHVVEKSPAIGGVMSELDKTFPTNDCAM
jgi:heterodisulfide reductase subunit A-like polyferredoxin